MNDPFTIPAGEPVPDPATNNTPPPADPAPVDSAPPIPGAGEGDPVAAYNAAAYDFVRMPDGSVHAVLKTDVHEAPATETQNIPAATMAVVPEQQFYVHLADGSVVRVKEKDLPFGSGSNATYGHWQREDKVYLVIGVYPVEDIVKGNN